MAPEAMSLRPARSEPPAAERRGRAVLRAYLNLVHYPDGPATLAFQACRRAGRAMDLAMRIRRQGSVSWERLCTFATFAGLGEFDLKLWCLKTLSDARMVEIQERADGGIVGVEEQVGIAAPLLAQAATLWDLNGPSAEERCAVASSDQLSYAPLPESVHRTALEQEGFPATIHNRVFAALQAVNLLRRQRSQRLGEDVLYSPYVWGTEAVDIAEFMVSLPPNERDVLTAVSRRVLEHPGVDLDALSATPRLLAGARKVGLIDSTRVLTSGGTERGFVFPPALERLMSSGSSDVMHERKLFVAHILYGHRYEIAGRGRIISPLALVSALVSRGTVGPTTSIREDYPLLEASGIVAVEERPGGRAYLRLVKQDVAEDSLELLRLALGEDDASSARSANPLDSLWLPGTFTTPERERLRVAELEPSAEAEVIESAVEQLREETQRRLRGEEL